MSGRILSALIWKNCLVRKRRFIMTILEYFLPVSLFVLLFVLGRLVFVTPVPKHSQHSSEIVVQTPDDIKMNDIEVKSERFFYTPDTEFTKQLMESVGKKLSLKQLSSFPGRRSKGYYPFDHISQIANYTASDNFGLDDAVIIFQNANSSSLPEKLKYTIRMKTPFMTQMDTSVEKELVPHESFGRIYEPFMRLQWAIDTSYLEMATGNEVPQSVTLQEFQFVSRAGNETIEAMVMLVTFAFMIGLYITFVILVSKLVGERINGVQELMKMSGVSSLMLGFVNLLDTLPGMVLFALGGALMTKVGAQPILLSCGFLLFLTLLLHAFTVFAVGYAVSYAIRTEQHSQLLAFLAFTMLAVIGSHLVSYVPHSVQLLIGFWPFTPIIWINKQIFQLEVYGVGLTFRSLASTPSPYPSALAALAWMLVQTALYLALAWYLDHVCPGTFGHSMPWNFLLKKQYWRQNNVEPDSELDESEQSQPITQQPQYFEPAPPQHDVGIKVVNITKVFPKHRALNNVSLDVYRGELTVLLGHNGAGKTTLMSIMTGTLKQTSGKVYVNGQDISKKQDARRHIGFCPQHNMFFPQLSVIEHAVIFSILRGQTYSQARKTSSRLLEQLGLGDKAPRLSHELSGGMQRRLQLACALAGDADVLVLDEPSSGLDVETRRSLWDLILALRGSRTVLISTHFMEEADALGDRVAALHSGVLRCHASPMYLKKAIGTGYRLTLITSSSKESEITSLVQSHVPEASLKENSLTGVSYALPAAAASTFPALFQDLESNRASLGIEAIGVGVSTLEEVFLALCSDVDTSNMTQDEVDGVPNVEPTYNKTSGCLLYCRQVYELMMRQIFYVIHTKYSFLIGQVLLPIVLIILLATQTNNEKETSHLKMTARTLDVGSYAPEMDYRVLYHTDREEDVKAISRRFPTVTFERVDDVAEAILNIGKRDTLEYHKYLAGIELNETDAKVMFTTTLRHAAPSALSLLANMLAVRLTPAESEPISITTVNHPLEQIAALQQMSLNQSKSTILATIFMIFLAFLILSTLASASALPITERVSGARWIHVMAGCPPELYWLVHLLFRTLIAAVTIILPLVIICACDPDQTFSEPVFIVAFAVILLLGMMAFLAFVFLFTFCCSQWQANLFFFILITVNVITTIAGAVDTPGRIYSIFAHISRMLFPGHALSQGMQAAGTRACGNAVCSLNRHLCPGIDAVMPGCCEKTGNLQCYFCFDGKNNAPGPIMLLLLVQLIFYLGLVFATQRGLVSWFVERLRATRGRREKTRYNDELVRAEKAYVGKAIELPTRQISDTMLVSNVHKSFGLIRPFEAIKGISFSVKKGECLGLLGVNGAGKSSTFRVLTAEDWPTGGQVFAAGHHRKGFSVDYMRRLGYCPQFFGLDDFLTGRRNLTLLLAMKGLDTHDAREETDSWIKIVGLERYAKRKVTGYSGGCQRRLAAAAALCLGAPLTLLDEPTSGVDVSARRRVWAALRRGMANQRAVIITSHSMDEMEALCHRIAIMSRGEVCALGSPGALRAAYAEGHAVVLKLRPPVNSGEHAQKLTQAKDETDTAATPLKQLKGTIHQTFDCTLKDEHKTMLHYHINETLPYSRLFLELERLRSAFPDYVEDYSVTETTLEEVFLSFARPADLAGAPDEEAAPRAPRPSPRVSARPV